MTWVMGTLLVPFTVEVEGTAEEFAALHPDRQQVRLGNALRESEYRNIAARSPGWISITEASDDRHTVSQPVYQFEKYDVIQSKNGRGEDPWQDFSTIREPKDAILAMRLVDTGKWEGEPLEFRIVRNEIGKGYVTKYERRD